MQVVEKLHRAVEEYRKQYGKRPNRILLKEEVAKALAAYLHERREHFEPTDLAKCGQPTPDEMFLDGNICYFKSIPVIAELEPDKELIVQ